MRTKQQGISLSVFLGWCIIAGFIVWLGVMIGPAFIEYRGIMRDVRAITTDAQNNPNANLSVASIRAEFSKKIDAGYTTSLKPEDLKVTIDGGRPIITFKYEKRNKLIGNAYLVLEFSGDSRI